MLVLAAVIGLALAVHARATGARREATTMWTLIALPVGDARCSPGWPRRSRPRSCSRYFAPVLGALLLFDGVGRTRDGDRRACRDSAVGRVRRPASSSYTPQYKSDMRDVGGEMAPLLHQGDLVVVGQPEQTPLADYYLPAGLRFADDAGPGEGSVDI